MLPHWKRDLEALKKRTFTMEELVGMPDHYRSEGAKSERDAVLRLMAARKVYYERGSREADGLGVREDCRAKVSLLESLIADIERGDHMKVST